MGKLDDETCEFIEKWLYGYLESISKPTHLAAFIIVLMQHTEPDEALRYRCWNQLNIFLKPRTESFINDFFDALRNKSYLPEDLRKQRLEAESNAENVSEPNANPPPASPEFIPEYDSDSNPGSEDPKISGKELHGSIKEYPSIRYPPVSDNDNYLSKGTTNDRQHQALSSVVEINTSKTPSQNHPQSVVTLDSPSADSTHVRRPIKFRIFPRRKNVVSSHLADSIDPSHSKGTVSSSVNESQKSQNVGRGMNIFDTGSDDDQRGDGNKPTSSPFPQSDKKTVKKIPYKLIPIDVDDRKNDLSLLDSIFEKAILKLEKTCLAIRKIPPHLNTVANLTSHFSMFGTVVDVEIPYQNRPDAALVQFENSFESTKAILSSQAVLNNRFIEIDWAFPTKSQSSGNQKRKESETTCSTSPSHRLDVQESFVNTSPNVDFTWVTRFRRDQLLKKHSFLKKRLKELLKDQRILRDKCHVGCPETRLGIWKLFHINSEEIDGLKKKINECEAFLKSLERADPTLTIPAGHHYEISSENIKEENIMEGEQQSSDHTITIPADHYGISSKKIKREDKE